MPRLPKQSDISEILNYLRENAESNYQMLVDPTKPMEAQSQQSQTNQNSPQQQTLTRNSSAATNVDFRVFSNFTDYQLEVLSKTPFWIGDKDYHQQVYKATDGWCCFNHIIGLPEKLGETNPIFPWQIEKIINNYEKYDYVWVLKATGLGVSEITMRWMAWKAFTGERKQYYGSTMPIVVGPNIDLARGLIDRMKRMFYNRLGIIFKTKDTIIKLPINNVTIKAFPSFNINAIRSLEKVSISFVDEGDFFNQKQGQQVLDAIERYIGKSRSKIILVSTPNQPEGLFETIDRDQNSIYKKLKLPYTVGLGTIYSELDIRKAKTSSSFEREYNLRYAFGLGDVFLEEHLQICQDIPYNPKVWVRGAYKTVGIDPTYGGGSSKFAFVVTQFVDGIIQVLHAEAFERPDPKFIEDYAKSLIKKYQIFEAGGQVLVDESNQMFIQILKQEFGESLRYYEQPRNAYYRMKIRPVWFASEHRKMLTKLQSYVSRGFVAINPEFDNLLAEMRIARADANYTLIKNDGPTLDLVDALRLSTYAYEI